MLGFNLVNILPRNKFYRGKFADKSLQSVCYDILNKKFIVGFSHKNNNQFSTLVKFSKVEFSDDSVEMVKENISLGHCNDMEFNPSDHRIYVVRGDRVISVVNPDTLEIEQNHTIDVNAWSIARYSNGDFFIHDGKDSRRYDSSFKNCLYISKNDDKSIVDILHVPYDPIDKAYAGYWQGAVTLDDEAYIIYTEWNGITDKIESGGKLVYNGDSRFKSCILFDPVTKDIMRCPTFMEAEGCCIAENQLFMFFGNEYFGIGSHNFDIEETHFDTFQTVHREIPTGESLNNIFTPGRYRSKNSGKTKTLKDLPNVEGIKDAGLYLEVMNVGLNHIRQTIYSNNFWTANAFFTRGYSFDYGWGPWYQLNATKV